MHAAGIAELHPVRHQRQDHVHPGRLGLDHLQLGIAATAARALPGSACRNGGTQNSISAGAGPGSADVRSRRIGSPTSARSGAQRPKPVTDGGGGQAQSVHPSNLVGRRWSPDRSPMFRSTENLTARAGRLTACLRFQPGRRAGRCPAAGGGSCWLAGCSGGASGSTGLARRSRTSRATTTRIRSCPTPASRRRRCRAARAGGGPAEPAGSRRRQPQPGPDPNVVATKLVEPTGLVVLPDGTALVGERKSGRIYRVQPQAGTPATLVQTLAGVDGSGDGGLLDLAISPTYAEDGLIYAYLTTATDNRVVHFALGSTPSVVIGGIPARRTGNVGRIAFDATGALLTGTGDAGSRRCQRIRPAWPARSCAPTTSASRAGQPEPDVAGVCPRPELRRDRWAVRRPADGHRLAISGNQVVLIEAGATTPAQRAATLPAAALGGGGCRSAGGQLLIATSTGKALAVGAAQQGRQGIGTFSPTWPACTAGCAPWSSAATARSG